MHLLFRSSPEFNPAQDGGEPGRNSLLRKTQSQPQPQQSKGKDKKKKSKKNASKSDANLSASAQAQDSSHPTHPGPLPLGDTLDTRHVDLERKTSCPTSPTAKEASGDKPKLENKKTAPGSLGGAVGGHPHHPHGGGSPKPKRNIFEGLKNTLRPKSKSQDNTSAAATQQQQQTSSSGTVYANMHSEQVTSSGDGGVTSSASAGAIGQESTDRKSAMTADMTSPSAASSSAVSE